MESGNGTRSHSEHRVVYDGGDPLDRFVLRCACGHEEAYFSYRTAAGLMDQHIGVMFVPVAKRPLTADEVTA